MVRHNAPEISLKRLIPSENITESYTWGKFQPGKYFLSETVLGVGLAGFQI
jgi:hypothetical protein